MDSVCPRLPQEKWLKEINKKFKKSCKYKISFAHHPYKSSGKHGDSKGQLKDFLEKNIIGQFHAYITGHDHHLGYEGAVKGTHLLISGSGATTKKIYRKHNDKQLFNIEQLGYIVANFKKLSAKKLQMYLQYKTVNNAKSKTVYEKKISLRSSL